MPVMDGITASSEIRSKGIKSPIVGLTANADEETRAAALRAGMNELLTKPISLKSLRSTTLKYRHRLSGESARRPISALPPCLNRHWDPGPKLRASSNCE